LGYNFNPISFWYLYSAEKNLSAMVCEVNNTFDERRPYFLKASEGVEPTDGSGINFEEASGEGNRDSTPKLRQTWPKDFHVSPFNSRKGSYSIVANDPLSPRMSGLGRLDNTITMSSSKNHGKLVARLFSTGSPLDPTEMAALQKLQFLASWWWVGFVTFPRIVRQAAALYYRRKLHVWYRPEPLVSSIGRRADAAELELESLFRKYLHHLVKECPAPVVLRYSSSGIPDRTIDVMASPAAQKRRKQTEEVELTVLTPSFYRRFIHYAHDFEAIFSEFRDSCTVSVDNPDMLPKLLLKKPPPALRTSNVGDYIYFRIIQRLRRRPERIERPLTSATIHRETPPAADIRDFRLSPMDGYILAQGDIRERKQYRSVVTRILLAERIACGSLQLLWLEQLILRAAMTWILSGFLEHLVSLTVVQ
jgi:hypothetical protein